VILCIGVGESTRKEFTFRESQDAENVKPSVVLLVGSRNRVRTDPGKVWKVVEFKVEIFQVWKIMENDLRYGKVLESHVICDC